MSIGLDKEGLILLVAAAAVGSIIFMGVVKLSKSALKASTSAFDSLDSTNTIRKQQRRMDDSKEMQRDFMRDQQQRIKDMQHSR